MPYNYHPKTSEYLFSRSKIKTSISFEKKDSEKDIVMIVCSNGITYISISESKLSKPLDKIIKLKKDEIDDISKRILNGIRELEADVIEGKCFSETIMEVYDYNGQSKKIHYIDEAPNRELGILEKELADMCVNIKSNLR